MPEGLWTIIGLLAVGYVLLLMELFVPGGILGVIGGIAIIIGCYQAFGMGIAWGAATVVLSVVVTVVGVNTFFRTQAKRGLMLSDRRSATWKAPEASLAELVGRRGVTVSVLRPSGVAEIDGRRIDVVADSEFLSAGVEIVVREVEGVRVVVEASAGLAPEKPPEEAPTEPPDEPSDPPSKTASDA